MQTLPQRLAAPRRPRTAEYSIESPPGNAIPSIAEVGPGLLLILLE